MKIAVISDLHLGFRQYGSLERENDFYNQFYKVCKEINKQNPDMLIIAGDLFDKPNPSPAAINAYRKGLGIAGTDIICVIKGNHTMLLRDGHFSIDDYFGEDEIEGYYYLDDLSMTTQGHGFESPYDLEYSKYTNMNNVKVDGITYRNNSDINEFIEVQNLMASEKVSEDTYRILVIHQSFKEFCGFFGEELSIEDINYKPYDVIICGHIHSRTDVKLKDNTWFIQPGSIERMNTTEALDEQKNGKGFYLIDTDKNSVEFYQVECDRKFFLGDIVIKSQEDLEKHLESLSEDVSKLKAAPIISYNYHDSTGDIAQIRDKIGLIKENILLNKSNIHDESQEEIILEIIENEMPTVLEAINMIAPKSGLTDVETRLAVDIYNALSKELEGVDDLLNSYYEENYDNYEEKNYKDEELEEIIRYFKNEV